MVDRTVRPLKSEVVDLRSAMRDIQVSIAHYHNSTAGFHPDSEAFETPARATVAFVQKVNDVMRAQIGQRDKYKRIFKRRLAEGDPGAELVEAFRYARNVMAHQLFRAAPASARVVGGFGLGYQTSGQWDPVPRRVHNRLHPPTRALKDYYDRRLVDRPVIDTFLDVALYFSTVCPLIVHRDDRQEWTGFPLRSQPGLSTRLHPAEPALVFGSRGSLNRNVRWLNSRLPGGDLRLICGRDVVDGRDLIYGLTFRGSASFSPFVETVEQAGADVDGGYPYHLCALDSALRADAFGPYRHGEKIGCWVSTRPMVQWLGEPIVSVSALEPFSTFMTQDEWGHQILLDHTDHLVRRSQRLAAVFPPV